METKNNKEHGEMRSWTSIAQGLASSFLERVSDRVSERVHTFVIRLEKKTIGGVMAFIGMIFVLVAIALLINSFFSGEFPWLGWGILGIIIGIIGYSMAKSDS